MREKTLSDKKIIMNEISSDFIGDKPEKMEEGTICPVGMFYEKDVKQFIKEMKEFIDDKTLQKKGLPERVVFMRFEWGDFIKEKLGELGE